MDHQVTTWKGCRRSASTKPSPLRPAIALETCSHRPQGHWQSLGHLARKHREGMTSRESCLLHWNHICSCIYISKIISIYIYSAYIIVECNDNIDDSYFFVTWEWDLRNQLQWSHDLSCSNSNVYTPQSTCHDGAVLGAPTPLGIQFQAYLGRCLDEKRDVPLTKGGPKSIKTASVHFISMLVVSE